jgi:hypothetical protein
MTGTPTKLLDEGRVYMGEKKRLFANRRAIWLFCARKPTAPFNRTARERRSKITPKTFHA